MLRKKWCGTQPTWLERAGSLKDSRPAFVQCDGARRTLSEGSANISFIRAMVYDPKILVLDEATSSVDHETEELIQQAIEKMMQGRTSIVIAHRLSTQRANKIIVLDHGEIKEAGRHDDLLQQDGYYSQLYRMQYKEFV
jgi:ATP-binding cassette subfamily B protein